MNIGVHKFFCICDLEFTGYVPSSGITGLKGGFNFTFLRKFYTVFIVAAPVCIPTNSALGFPFPYNPSNTCWFLCL